MSEEAWPVWATESVSLVEHDRSWAAAGAREVVQLQRLLAPWLVADVEHVGSTAIPGLAAKPILDFQAAVADLGIADDVAATLAGQRWHYVPPALDQRPDRRFYVKVREEHRTAHLHLLVAGGDRWYRQLAFRDALRSDPERRDAYARLKVSLAERFRDDREAYTAGKQRFVEDVLG